VITKRQLFCVALQGGEMQMSDSAKQETMDDAKEGQIIRLK